MTSPKPLLICLMGPTASGKTDLATALAQRLDCELVSVDSALVYRGMDIGSAKPTYPHHLVDIRDPADPYSAADFAADATRLAAEIVARGKTPLLVGGTMLYFKAFLDGLAAMPAADPALRRAIEQQAAERGWPHIHAQLASVDPESAARIHPNHSQRLARALEIYRATGRSLSDWHRQQSAGPSPFDQYHIRQLAICPRDRRVLHQRIGQRFEHMLQLGLVEEVRALHGRGDLDAGLPAMRAVGYRQLWRYLEGEYSLQEAVEKAQAATRQLAKRQLTWLRKWDDLCWIHTDELGRFEQMVLPRTALAGAAQPNEARSAHAAGPAARQKRPGRVHSSAVGSDAYQHTEPDMLLRAALNYLHDGPM